LDRAVIDVGGVGYLVFATPGTLAALRVGERAHVKTVLVVREDSQTLYGFADADERELFEQATSVTGVGPRIGLALLAVHAPDAIRLAVHTQDVKAFTRVPGIGPKVAQRILLELSGKLAPPSEVVSTSSTTGSGSTTGDGSADSSSQVVEALVGLGYQAKAATDAVAAVAKDSGGNSDASQTLRAALRVLGGRK